MLRLLVRDDDGNRRHYTIDLRSPARPKVSKTDPASGTSGSHDAQLSRDSSREIGEFARLVDWVQRLRSGDVEAAKGPPDVPGSDARDYLARGYVRAQALRQGRNEKIGQAGRDPLGLEHYFALADGRWSDVLAATDDPDANIPQWIAPALLSVSGDRARLRALAEQAPEPAGMLGVFEGLSYQMFGFDRRAYESMRAGLAWMEPRDRASHYVPLADLAAVLEGESLAVRTLAWAIAARPNDDRQLMRAVVGLLRYGGFSEAYRALMDRAQREPAHFEVFVRLTTLALWCGRPEEAARWNDEARKLQPDAVEVIRADAIAAALAGRHEPALQLFESLGEQADAQTLCWQAELQMRAGQPKLASRLLELARARAQTPVHTLLEALITGEVLPGLEAALAAIGADRGDGDARAVLAAAQDSLALFQGNRSETPTRTPDAHPAEPAELRRVGRPPRDMLLVSRDAAADLLKTIRVRSVEDLHEQFATLCARYPDSPHPWCYWGELRLWLGQFEQARECFESPQAAEARWAYVGRAACHIHDGDLDAALAEFDSLSKAYTPVPGATTHVYLGELYWLRGDFDAALAELQTSVEVKPGRISAHILMALCRWERGERDAAAAIFGELVDAYPRLLWDACRSLGCQWPPPEAGTPELLRQVLRSMRGNRSSHTITYFDAAGVLRLVVDARTWREHAAKRAHLVERELLAQLTS